MKETFIMRTEWMDSFLELQPIEKATLLDNLFYYHSGQHNLINLTNLSVKLVWKLIEPNMKRNMDTYDKRILTSKENGKLGGRPITKNNLTEPNKPNVTLSDCDSVCDSEPVNVRETEIVYDNDIVNEKKTRKKNGANAPPPSDYSECIELYNDFVKKLTGGAGAKIDGQQGKAMKSIIAYMQTQMKEQGARVSTGLKVIFDNWHKLEPFLQKQTTLAQINSNLQNIIIQIKNNAKSTDNGKERAIYGRLTQTEINKFMQQSGTIEPNQD